MNMPWYKTGTVKTTINSNAIIGTGTAFISNSRVGDAFRGPDGNWYEVVNIASDTAMSISPNYQGPTVAAGAYSVAPMQGYTKESADRLRQTVESFGATLALFGSATNVTQLRANIGAAQNGTNSDITNITGLTTALSIAQGGTGAKTAPLARTALGLGDAAVMMVAGAGGIIERGATANGQYTKYADGTLICWTDTLVASLRTATYMLAIWAMPSPFMGTLPCVVTVTARQNDPGTSDFPLEERGKGTLYGKLTSNSQAFVGFLTSSTNSFSVGAQIPLSAMAVGRWKA